MTTEQYVILHVSWSRVTGCPLTGGGSMDVWHVRETVRDTRTIFPSLGCRKIETIRRLKVKMNGKNSYGSLGMVCRMIAGDPNILPVAVSVIGRLADVRPEKSVPLRGWPDSFVDLQDHQRVIGDSFEHFHLLQRG